MSNSGDLWYVKLATGDVHRATLDQIEEAFEGGHIDGKTMVLAADETEWKTLGELAGLDDEPAIPVARPAAPRYAPAPTPTPTYATSYAPQPYSLRPITMDFGDDEMAAFRGGSRKRWGAVLFAAAAVAGIAGVAVMRPEWRQMALRAGGLESTAAIATAPPAAAATPGPTDPPSAAATPPETPRVEPSRPTAPSPVQAATPANDSPLTPRFTDQQRKTLLDSDKQRDDRTKAHSKDRVTGANPHSGSKIKSSGFTTDGNKFDPLNSSI